MCLRQYAKTYCFDPRGNVLKLVNCNFINHSKGLGFIPTPEARTNNLNTRLDMRLTINRIISASGKTTLSPYCDESSPEPPEERPSPQSPMFPQKLSHKSYYASLPSDDRAVNDIVNSMESELDQLLQASQPKKPKAQNLTPEEKAGLVWINERVDSDSLAVVEADKGGSILLVDPQMLRRKTLEKLENPILYKKLQKDPVPDLQKSLFNIWVRGKEQGLISAEEAKYVMGVSDNPSTSNPSQPTNRPSTAPRYKPGKSYFYPSLKVHKLSLEELIPGVEPPIRLITALQDGISKRSDVFIAAKFLKDLEKEYCEDLLSDTTDALLWLDQVNTDYSVTDKMRFKSFTYDFKALYDSLNPSLVIEALQHAMNTCRTPWSPEFKKWILDLATASLDSSIGLFEGTWYKQINGVPTGGSLCVQLANIAVFYILNKKVYTNPDLMKDVGSIKRYIDDGAGQFKGTHRQFTLWLKKVNELLSPYGLLIDESQIENVGSYVSFLDIKFMFDDSGELQTDLHVKATDSRAYLHFSSNHPNHVFSGVVYSQCLRLRRIINSQDRLKTQLELLKCAFLDCGYPKTMVSNISTKVLGSDRVLERKAPKTKETPLSALPIRVVSAYGSDEDLLSIVKKYEPELNRTRSFSESDVTPPPSRPRSRSLTDTELTTPPSRDSGGSVTHKRHGLFQYVKKTLPSLRSQLVKTKELALGKKHGRAKPCGVSKCMCCNLLMHADSLRVNGKYVRCAPGNCKTYNIVYLVQCSLCKN